MARPARVSVTVDRAFRNVVDTMWLRRLARTVLAAEQTGPGVELSLTVSGDPVVRSLNRTFRGKDATTDVLSFPLVANKGGRKFVLPPDGLRHLGEVIVSYPQAERQAGEKGHPVNDELAILVVHGILHLLGYNHVGKQAARMTDREQALLHPKLGLSAASLTEGAKRL